MNLNISDYKVLNSIIDRDTGKGASKLRGVTVVELVEITGFSSTKIRNSLKKLIDRGFVDYAIKRVRSDAFHITEEGMNEMVSIGKSVVSIDDNPVVSEKDNECFNGYKTDEVVDVEYSEEEEGDVE